MIRCIVACGVEQRRSSSRADWLYLGRHHRAMLGWALRKWDRDEVRILSTNWGLVSCSALLAPYDPYPITTAPGLQVELLREQLRTQGVAQVVTYAGGVQYVRPLIETGLVFHVEFRGSPEQQIEAAESAADRLGRIS